MQIPILPSDVILQKMNPPTRHIINFIETSPTHPVLNELPFILIEIYKIAIDMYTLSKELFWYFDTDVRVKYLLPVPDKFKPTKGYYTKRDLLDDINWKLVAMYLVDKFKFDEPINFSNFLMSYHYPKYVKDSVILDSGRYTLTNVSKKGGHRDYLIELRIPDKYI